MRLKCLIVAAAFALSLLRTGAVAQAMTNNGALAPANASSAPLNLLFLPRQNGNIGVFATNVSSGLQVSNLLTAARLGSLKRLSPVEPRPGVYKTEPYACIVVVPGNHPDDASVVKPTERGSPMPVIRPELRFVPFQSK